MLTIILSNLSLTCGRGDGIGEQGNESDSHLSIVKVIPLLDVAIFSIVPLRLWKSFECPWKLSIELRLISESDRGRDTESRDDRFLNRAVGEPGAVAPLTNNPPFDEPG